MSVELLIGDDTVTVKEPKDIERVVNKLTDTGEQIRLEGREPTQKELDAIVRAAEFLTSSAVNGEMQPAVDEVRAAMAAGALAGVLHDPRMENAYIQMRDVAFPVDAPLQTAADREINEIQRRKFDIAKELTDSETSFVDALDLAGMTPDADIDVSELVPEKELRAHETPPTYDELLERVYEETSVKAKVHEVLRHAYNSSKPNDLQLYGGGELFSAGQLAKSHDPEGTIAMVNRVQAALAKKKEAAQEQRQQHEQEDMERHAA